MRPADPPNARPKDAVTVDTPRKLTLRRDTPDRVFRGAARAGGVTVLAIMLLVGVFLAFRASQALGKDGLKFFTTQAWDPDNNDFGIAAVLFGTVLIALVAVVIAFPLATATALYITEYAPRQLRQALISLVDLMAAIPSVVYGLWGFFFLQGEITPVAQWIARTFGWIPVFSLKGVDPNSPLPTPTTYTSSTFIAGIVVGLMITPIVTSIMREVFTQTPEGEREAAFALGATKWGVVRSVVLPFGTGGMIGGTMLGLGRALGETIAVYMIISPVFVIQPHILQAGAISVSSLIALMYSETSPFGLSALMAAGLTLFVMTLIINFIASSIVARSRSGASS